MAQLLTVLEAAAVLNVKERYIRRLIAERRVTVVRVGRLVRIPQTAIDALIAAGTVEARAPRSRRHLGRVA